MPIHIRFQEGGEPNKELPTFQDSVKEIVIGRDPARCQVVFSGDNRVGREHCVLERHVGRYRVRVNQEDVVLVNGRRVFDNEQLPPSGECQVQLGDPGPTLLVRTWLDGNLVPTSNPTPRADVPVLMGQIQKRGRLGLTFSLVAIVLVAAGLGWWQWQLQLTHRELSDAAERVKHGLMLIGYPGNPNDPNSQLVIATGFLIDLDRRLVATNAHVGDMQTKAATLLAFPNGAAEHYQVEHVYYHPGEVRISPQGVRKRSIIRADGVVDQFSPDVAILQLKDDGKPFPPGVTKVELATPEEVQALSYSAVGMSGYPGATTQFPTQGTVLSPDTRFGNINRVTGFDQNTQDDSRNNQLVAYTMTTAGGFSGSPLYLKNGHVVAINNSHRVESGTSQTYGIRIDCLWELLADFREHHGSDKLIPLPSGLDQAQLHAHVDPSVQSPEDASASAAVALLQSAHLLDTSVATTAAGQPFNQKDFEDKLSLCAKAISQAGKFPFVYLARGRLYGQMSDAKQLPPGSQMQFLKNADQDFQMALGLGSAHAPPLDPKCYEATLSRSRIKWLMARVPASGVNQDDLAIIEDVDQVLNDQTTPLTKRLQSLAWRIRAKCHWNAQEAGRDLDQAVSALPQWTENLRMRAEYLSSAADYFATPAVNQAEEAKKAKDQAQKDTEQAKRIPTAISSAHEALAKATKWKTTPHAADDTKDLKDALSSAEDAVKATNQNEWNCLDCFARIRAIGSDPKAVQTALEATRWAPDATETFQSEEDVYEIQKAGEKSP
jgi:hypothetical protein